MDAMERFDPALHRCPFSHLCMSSAAASLVFVTALLLFA
jgi:hypothetical protein